MARFGNLLTIAKYVIMVIGIPLALVSTGYALYSQKLTVVGATTKPAYSIGQKMLFTYNKTVVQAGANWNYTISGTVKNNGLTATSSWTLKFDLPVGATPVCSGVTCTTSGQTVTAASQTANNSITAGASANFTITFTTTTSNYQLQNIITAAVLPTAYATYSGLTAAATRTSGPTKSGSKYMSAYRFTVTNNTAQPMMWRIQAAPWSTTYTVNATGTDTTMNYASQTSALVFTSKTAVAPNATFTFNVNITTTSSTWAFTSWPITGYPQ